MHQIRVRALEMLFMLAYSEGLEQRNPPDRAKEVARWAGKRDPEAVNEAAFNVLKKLPG